MTRIRSQLSGLPSGPTPFTELRKMAAAAWKHRGVAIIWLTEVNNDFDRQAIKNVCNKLYGPSDATKPE